ncbi:sensor histidine kinase [Streptomyces sp. NBC_00859]|uniref:sensor histidine kinase n=1 Tax=Streptomyces sp. NBC_00859 TaxID=2903682 RepID=UPI0038702DB3|nr:histidine kinase [Streptomyces sp. NBC_00859]
MNALFGPRARQRWIHLVLGGALLMPYFLAASSVTGRLAGGGSVYTSLPLQLVSFAGALPLAALTALAARARPLSVLAARALCGTRPALLADGPAGSWAARVRTAGWFTLHTGLGGVLGALTLTVPPLALLLVALPFSASLRGRLPAAEPADAHVFSGWSVLLAPLTGAALLFALAGCAAAAGALLARAAPVLLGPAPMERLAAAERRAADLAARNRLARELHDSVGHALSAVTLQAGAARRVLDTDREFVREALAAIEETTRRTVGELDAVLGLLRQQDTEPPNGPADGTGAKVPAARAFGGPALDAVDGLIARCGLPVVYAGPGDPAQAPERVSREAYRIVQEGLSNVLRHGGPGPVELRITLDGRELAITMVSRLPDPVPRARPGGGRGLPGISERAALLGGECAAGAVDGVWRLAVRLPLGKDTG